MIKSENSVDLSRLTDRIGTIETGIGDRTSWPLFKGGDEFVRGLVSGSEMVLLCVVFLAFLVVCFDFCPDDMMEEADAHLRTLAVEVDTE